VWLPIIHALAGSGDSGHQGGVCVCVESSDWLKSDQGCVGGARLRHESFQRSRVVVAYDEEKQDKAEEKHMSSRRKD